ncbi:MAG: chemotaxis protein CheX [Limisphaerales bacterium]|jgi:chemotaxis protein CheX
MDIIEELDRMVDSAVSDIFATMLNLPIDRIPNRDPNLCEGEHVAASVGFNGRLNGVVYSYCSGQFAREITGSLLGVPDDEIEDELMVNDAMGEIANMVVGQLKSQLFNRGLPCVLTIPSIVRGEKFSVRGTSSTTHKVSLFKSHENELVVELMLKSATGSDN